MERAQQLRIFWAYKWWLLAFAITAALTVYFVSGSRTSTYRGEALAQIVSSRQAAGELLSEEELFSLSNVFVKLASTDTVRELAHDNEAVAGDSDEFDANVSVEPQERVGILSFSAENESPERAATWANAYATAFVEYADQLQTRQRRRAFDRIQARIDAITAEIEANPSAPNDPAVAGLRAELAALQERVADETAAPGDTVRVIQRAVPPDDAVSPQPLRDALLALIGALIIGAAVAYVRETLVDRYGSPEEASADLGLQIIGEIPKAGPDVPVLEAFRRLRTAVVVALDQGGDAEFDGARSVLVTGAEPGSGKSFVTANLARALAAEGWKVVAVDGDLRRPTLHEHFGIPRQPGLGDLLAGDGLERHADRLAFPVSSEPGRPEDQGELRALTAGPYIEDSVERLSSRRMMEIVARLKETCDFVVFDSPPALAVVDPVVLARYSDGVVMVLDSRKTKRRDARVAVQTMRAIGTPVLGMVYNRSQTPVGSYYSYDAPTELSSSKTGVRGAAR